MDMVRDRGMFFDKNMEIEELERVSKAYEEYFEFSNHEEGVMRTLWEDMVSNNIPHEMIDIINNIRVRFENMGQTEEEAMNNDKEGEKRRREDIIKRMVIINDITQYIASIPGFVRCMKETKLTRCIMKLFMTIYRLQRPAIYLGLPLLRILTVMWNESIETEEMEMLETRFFGYISRIIKKLRTREEDFPHTSLLCGDIVFPEMDENKMPLENIILHHQLREHRIKNIMILVQVWWTRKRVLEYIKTRGFDDAEALLNMVTKYPTNTFIPFVEICTEWMHIDRTKASYHFIVKAIENMLGVLERAKTLSHRAYWTFKLLEIPNLSPFNGVVGWNLMDIMKEIILGEIPPSVVQDCYCNKERHEENGEKTLNNRIDLANELLHHCMEDVFRIMDPNLQNMAVQAPILSALYALMIVQGHQRVEQKRLVQMVKNMCHMVVPIGRGDAIGLEVDKDYQVYRRVTENVGSLVLMIIRQCCVLGGVSLKELMHNDIVYFYATKIIQRRFESIGNKTITMVCYRNYEDYLYYRGDKYSDTSPKEEETCPVCLNEMKEENSQWMANTSCGHTFHATCLLLWMKKSKKDESGATSNCPLCRQVTEFNKHF
jgi:hypothetical protein